MTAATRWPGFVATALLVLATSLWTFWGISELYWEGWGLPFPQPLFYLAPGAALLALSVLALRFPAVGGAVILGLGGWFTWWWSSLMHRRGGNLLRIAVTTFPGSSVLVVVGVLLFLEARRRRALRAAGAHPPASWLRRNTRSLVAVGIPAAIIAGVSAFQLPVVLSRVDDGIRSARVIEGNGVRLRWAPAGPGWNWKQQGGWILSWDHLATYGRGSPGLKPLTAVNGRMVHASAADMSATGLCAYLTADGRSLSSVRLGLWRMPTADEVVRSLSRNGQNARCAWMGGAGISPCARTGDKETPLWAPDQSPIYYWVADEAGADSAWYVAYNGAVRHQPKNFGNSRHGYRCVQDVLPSPP